MENLGLHSEGQSNHLETMREKYAKLRESLKSNPKLSASQKQAELKKLDLNLEESKKNSHRNLY